MMWSVQGDWPLPVPHLFAAAAGASLPPIGSCVRARWAYVLDGSPRDADGIRPGGGDRRGRLHPRTEPGHRAGHVVAPAGRSRRRRSSQVSAGTLALATQRRTEPPAHPPPAGPRGGTADRLAHCRAAGRGLPGARHPVRRAPRSPPSPSPRSSATRAGRRAAGAVGASAACSPADLRRRRLAAATSPVRVGSAALMAADGPARLRRLLPADGPAAVPRRLRDLADADRDHVAGRADLPMSRLTEGMAMMQTGLVAGVAPGAPARGLVIDHVGASAAYLVSLAAGVLAGPGRPDRPASRGPPDGRVRARVRRSKPCVTAEWRNWSGLETRHPDPDRGARRRRGRGRGRGRAGAGRGEDGQDGRDRAQLHGDRGRRSTRCSGRPG